MYVREVFGERVRFDRTTYGPVGAAPGLAFRLHTGCPGMEMFNVDKIRNTDRQGTYTGIWVPRFVQDLRETVANFDQ